MYATIHALRLESTSSMLQSVQFVWATTTTYGKEMLKVEVDCIGQVSINQSEFLTVWSVFYNNKVSYMIFLRKVLGVPRELIPYIDPYLV
jgi:hypothetical protein